MFAQSDLDLLEAFGCGADINELELRISECQDAHASGNSLVDDATYDGMVRLLKRLKPDSSLFNHNWEKEDNELESYDIVLKKYGMTSITTITSINELGHFKDVLKDIGHPVDMMAGTKENGHGVRAVYVNGHLKAGSTRGRSKKGRDITRHIKAVLPNYIEDWDDIDIVEVRGEMLVSLDNFEKHLKGKLKTPLSSVTSLIRDSVTDDELSLLEMVCYKVISGDGSLEFDTLWDEYQYLLDHDFKIPERVMIPDVTVDNVEEKVAKTLSTFEDMMDKGKMAYACDGIVFAINDNDTFYSTGKNGNAWNGNFALKAGRYWESNVYSSTILEIEFIPGKSYLTPKAKVVPVVTATGATVENVPLYNIGVMERYGYTPGNTVFFRFGGETGVTTCDVNGRSVSLTA